MFGFLLRFARKVVEGVLSQLTQQLHAVQEMALAPMRAMVQQVVGGVWRGEGANAFVDEVNSLMIPDITRVAETITGMSSNLHFAQSVIDRADEEVDRLIKSRIVDAFEFF
jgi:uncharacterized protein YukE